MKDEATDAVAALKAEIDKRVEAALERTACFSERGLGVPAAQRSKAATWDPERFLHPGVQENLKFKGKVRRCAQCGRKFMTTPKRRMLCARCFAGA